MPSFRSRFSVLGLLVLALAGGGCGSLIGLDGFKKGDDNKGAGGMGGSSTGGNPSTECSSASDCDDGVDCTVEACTAGKCSNAPDDSLCPTASCSASYCDATLGCQTTIGSGLSGSSGEMLLNGNFDLGDTGAWYWTTSTLNNQLIIDPTIYVDADPPPTLPYEAWLGGYASETSAIAQEFTVEQGTQSISVSFQHLILSDGSPHDLDDYGWVSILDGSETVANLLTWDGADENFAYSLFNAELGIAELTKLGPKTLTIAFYAVIDADADITSQHVDSVSVTATPGICGL